MLNLNTTQKSAFKNLLTRNNEDTQHLKHYYKNRKAELKLALVEQKFWFNMKSEQILNNFFC